jgi:hypothetical protein
MLIHIFAGARSHAALKPAMETKDGSRATDDEFGRLPAELLDRAHELMASIGYK